jgi:DNA-binding LytR/AlgR family response regulator
LDELEQIAGSGFYRANRQYLINRKAIKDTSQYFARKLAVNLNVPLDDKITISKNKVSEFLNWLTIS